MRKLFWVFTLEMSLALPLLAGYTTRYLHGNAAAGVSSRLWRRKVSGQEAFQRDAGVVYYDMDPYLPSRTRELVVRALESFNDVSCVKWLQLYPWEDDQYYKLTFRFGARDNRCWYASSGRGGRTDVIWLGEWCVQTVYSGGGEARLRGVLMYEMMRAVGLYGEHTRPNRDCWIQLDGRLSREISLHKVSDDSFFSDFPYDFQSATHYPSWAVRGMHSRQQNVTQLGRLDGYVSFEDYQRLTYLACNGPSYCQSLQAGPEGVDGWRENCKAVLRAEQSLAGQDGCQPNVFQPPESYFATSHEGVCHRVSPTPAPELDVVSELAPERPCHKVCKWPKARKAYHIICKCHTLGIDN